MKIINIIRLLEVFGLYLYVIVVNGMVYIFG